MNLSEESVGKKFQSFEEFKKFLQKYQQDQRQVITTKNSERLKPDEKNQESIQYKKIHYCCKFGGDCRTEAKGYRQSR